MTKDEDEIFDQFEQDTDRDDRKEWIPLQTTFSWWVKHPKYGISQKQLLMLGRYANKKGIKHPPIVHVIQWKIVQGKTHKIIITEKGTRDFKQIQRSSKTGKTWVIWQEYKENKGWRFVSKKEAEIE